MPSADFIPGAKIIPISPTTKRPALIGWQAAATSDRAQIAAWAVQFPGCGWAIACAESGLIGVEIDVKARKFVKVKNSQKAGPERAERAWHELWTSHGDTPPGAPHTYSPSGGGHFYFLPPPGVDVKALRQGGLVKLDGWQQSVIETRVNGYLLIPPSAFDGRVYTRPEHGPSEPYHAPTWLTEMMMRKKGTLPAIGDAPAPIVKPGSYELRPLAKYVCKIHHRVGMPREVWMAAIFALVAQYGRYVAWKIAHAIHDGEPDTSDQIDDLVGRARETFEPGDSTLKSLFKYAQDNGIRDIVPKSLSEMFGLPAEPLDLDAILAEIDAEFAAAGAPGVAHPTPEQLALGEANARAMFGARGEAHVRLFSPILAAVPVLPRTGAHPEMPETGHPLRDAINAAIPGIATKPSEYFLAHAVINLVHSQTAEKIWPITSAVKARTANLEAEEVRATRPNDWTRFNGTIERDNPDNVRFYLDSIGVEVRWNDWLEQVEVKGWKWSRWTRLTDMVVTRLRMDAARTGTRFNMAKEFA